MSKRHEDGSSSTAPNDTRQPYQTPRIRSYSSEEILASLGPAIAIYGYDPTVIT